MNSSGQARSVSLAVRVAAHILAEIDGRNGFAGPLLSQALRRHRDLSYAERGRVTEIVYAVLRNRRRLDDLAEPGVPATDVSRTPRANPGRGALERAVARCRALPRLDDPDALRRLERISDPVARLALRTSLPDWLAERFVSQHGLETATRLALALLEEPPLTIRANMARIARAELIARLESEGFAVEPTRVAPQGIRVLGGPSLWDSPTFHAGLFEVQDEGSQLVSELVAPPRDATVVDACAGAGGKTLHLASLLQGRGRVFACDVPSGARRLAELRRRARRAELHNISWGIESEDGPLSPRLQKLIGRADRVLVDAPCSGTGVLRRNPESKDRLTPEQVERLPKLQLSILERFAPLVEPGGRLVYATCSLLTEENEGVVTAFLAEHPEFSVPPSDDPSGRACLRPDTHGTDGFFAAALIRR